MIVSPSGNGFTNVIAQSAELPNINQPSRFFRDSQDKSWNFRSDLTIPFTPGNGLESSIKVGGNVLESERRLREQRFEYEISHTTGANQPDVVGYANSVLNFQGQQFITNATGSGANSRTAYYFPNATFLRSGLPFDGYGYDGTQSIPAVYAMADLFVLPKFRLVGGPGWNKPTSRPRCFLEAGFWDLPPAVTSPQRMCCPPSVGYSRSPPTLICGSTGRRPSLAPPIASSPPSSTLTPSTA